MKQQIDTFSNAENEILSSLIDSQWNLVAGNEMDELNFAWQEILLGTSKGSFRIASQSRELDFEGYWDDYSVLEISESDAGLTKMQNNGHVFYQCKGEVIERIWIIRDQLTRSINNVDEILYLTDSGIVFETNKSWIAVMKASHRTEALRVDIANDKDTLSLGNLAGRWESDLLTKYEYVREWIEISKK